MKKNLSYLSSAYFENTFRFAFFTGTIIIAGLMIFRILLIFSYSGEVGGIDNNFVYGVLRNLKGYDLYTNPSKFPYAVTLYSPLYYNICSGIGKILNINADEPINIYRLCRSVSLVFDIVTCAILFLTLKKRFNVNKELCWLATACFACILCLLGYTFSRCDSLSLLLYTASIYLLTSPFLTSKNYLIFLLSLGSVACIFSKQSGIIVPVIVCAWMLFENNPRKVVYYIAFTGMTFAAFSFIYLYAFNYHYLFTNTITGLQNKIDFSWFYTNIFKRFMDSLWVLPLYIGGFIALKYLVRPQSINDKKWAIVFIIQFVFGLGISLKWGSSVSYFYESFFLSFIIIGKTIQEAGTASHSVYIKRITGALIPIFTLFFIHTIAQGYLFYIQKGSEKQQQYTNQKQIRDYIKPLLKDSYVLNLGNENADFFKAFFYKEIAVPNYDIVNCCTLPDNTFDYSSLKQDIINGKISFLLASEKTEVTDIWGISLKDFHKDTVLNGIAIYQFKKPVGIE